MGHRSDIRKTNYKKKQFTNNSLFLADYVLEQQLKAKLENESMWSLKIIKNMQKPNYSIIL